MKIKGIIAFWLVLCLSANLTYAVMGADRASAAVLRMAGMEGDVAVSSQNGRGVSVKEDMKLYSGYNISTGQASYAYVSLDNTKAVKMDALSEAEIRKSGKMLELLVNSGKLFFNVTEPLSSEEALNIRTSTMVTGVRGTSGVVDILNGQVSTLYLLDGEARVTAKDPVTGETRNSMLHAGQKATAIIGIDESDREYSRIYITELKEEEITGFAAQEIAKDKALQERIRNATDLNVDLIIMGADERLRADQAEAAAKQNEALSGQAVSVDPLFESGSAANNADLDVVRGSSGDSHSQSSVPESTVPQKPSDSTISLEDMNSGQLDKILSDAFRDHNQVTMEPGSGGGDQVPAIKENITIPSGKTLIMDGRVSIDPAAAVTVEGTVHVKEELENYGAIRNNGSNTFIIEKDAYFINNGIFENNGRLVVNGSFIVGNNTEIAREDSVLINNGLIINSGELKPAVWDYGTGSYSGCFINSSGGKVENHGTIRVSYANDSDMGNPSDWASGDGLLEIDYEYESDKEDDFQALCSQAIGGSVSYVLLGYPGNSYRLTAGKTFYKIMDQIDLSFEYITLTENTSLTHSLIIEGLKWAEIYLNGYSLNLDGAAIVNKANLCIYGGSIGNKTDVTGMVYGVDTKCVIENRGTLTLANCNITLNSTQNSAAPSYAVHNYGGVALGSFDNECIFINNCDNGWAFVGTDGSYIDNQDTVTTHLTFISSSEGHTINLDPSGGFDDEFSDGGGYKREIALDGRISIYLYTEPSVQRQLEKEVPEDTSLDMDENAVDDMNIRTATDSNALKSAAGEEKQSDDSEAGGEDEEDVSGIAGNGSQDLLPGKESPDREEPEGVIKDEEEMSKPADSGSLIPLPGKEDADSKETEAGNEDEEKMTGPEDCVSNLLPGNKNPDGEEAEEDIEDEEKGAVSAGGGSQVPLPGSD